MIHFNLQECNAKGALDCMVITKAAPGDWYVARSEILPGEIGLCVVG